MVCDLRVNEHGLTIRRAYMRGVLRAVDERLVHHLSTISVAAKPRTASVSNIIAPIGICVKNSINLPPG
jgi:hypothetical protein